MKLWLIKTEEYGYDDFDGFVIRAETEKQARDLALKESNQSVFADASRSSCVEIFAEGNSEIVLGSYNAG